jgi:hypothetical protein
LRAFDREEEIAMKKLVLGSVLMAAAACASQPPPAMTAAQQSDFQKAIAGRTPGRPQICVPMMQLRGNKSYGEGIIVFEGATSSTVYVNRPPNGCPELRWDRALRTRTTSAQLCSNDIVTVFDPTSGMQYGSCSLGEFVEYRRR